ncbi:hypothetical protein AB0I49_29220 [Streptomyces sp. NPDC050617]|uniref:hypothetical protein n=1 Tax=Streptomyces sp. NPDC050617 TaxID=3154628 RepID=UPI00343A7641
MNVIATFLFGLWMIASGIAHFVKPAYMRGLIPSWVSELLPRRLGRVEFLVAASGVADIFAGFLILLPSARTVGGWAAAALVCLYLVSHVDALVQKLGDRARPRRLPIFEISCLVVNFGYIGWAVAIALTAR